MSKRLFPALLLLSLGFYLSACIGLIPLEQEPKTGEFGPSISPQEQQTKTFEALWKHLEERYIYFENADVDWDALHDTYAGQIKAGLTPEEFTSLMKELESRLPEGSLMYQSREERIQNDVADTSSYEGIGAFIGFNATPEPHIVLLAVMDGSPAETAGLEAHDSIFAIDGNPVLLEEGIKAADRVRGPAGSSVTLRIKTPGTAERSVEVKRGRLAGTGKLAAHTIPGTNYGYLLFPPIGYDTLTEDVVKSLQSMTASKKLDGLILDLRVAGSSGGWPLEAMSALFYNGSMGAFYNRTDKQEVTVKGQNISGSQTVPLVILVGQNTTGSPEIFSAGLQSHKRATVIGEQTPGNIEASSAFYLPNGSQALIETTSFVLSNGDEIGVIGVTPDIVMEQGWDEVLPNGDPVFDQAVQYLDK